MNPRDNKKNWERKMKIIANSEIIPHDPTDFVIFSFFNRNLCYCCRQRKTIDKNIVYCGIKYPTCNDCIREASEYNKESSK